MSDSVSTSPSESGDATAGTQPAADPAVPPGASLGRYVVLETIAHGGMGRVLRAYDPKLQREVALKVVRTDPLGAEAHARLLREARAMAKLSHPNVVAVYDAEESSAGIVLVMEYVHGQTLRAWTRDGTHGWAEILERYRGAGRGLAAAHAEGLLHRDFKPANVLVSESGAVKVTDFGLAKLAPREEQPTPTPSPEASSDSLDGTVTRADVVMGTPRYMAPEQLRSRPLTAAADQYAFCTSIWEALRGVEPFDGTDARTLLRQKLRGPPPWSPTGDGTAADGLPRSIAEAIRRGLAPRPDDRWPDMDALLEALAPRPSRRRRVALAGGGALAILGLGLTAEAWTDARARRCSGGRAELEGVWDPARREAVERAITGTGVGYAPAAWARVGPRLDAYADAWVAMHTEACEATTVRGEQSATLMDLRMACLRRAKVELAAAVDVLEEADAAVVERAHEVVAGLDPLDRCADVEALQSEVEGPSPADAEAVEAIRADLATSKAETEAGAYGRARAAAERARTRLADVDYEPVAAEVALQEGRLLEELGEYDAAAAALGDAVRQGTAHQQWRLVGTAATRLLFVVGVRQQRPDEALRYRELAEGLSRGDLAAEAAVHDNLGGIARARADYATAEAEQRLAVELLEKARGPDDPDVARARNNLANALYDRGKHAAAEAEYRRALAVYERALGPDHPSVAMVLNNLAAGLYARKRYAEAEVEFRRAQARWEAAVGPDHPGVAEARGNVAVTLQAQGKHHEAELELRAALAFWERTLGPDHPSVATTCNNLANALQAQDEHEKAEAQLRRALAVWERTLGPDHPNVALARANLGGVLEDQGKLEEAEAQLRRALALREASLDTDHPGLASSRQLLASFLLRHGRPDEALDPAERAWARRQQDDIPTADRAATAFLLARVLWARSERPSTPGPERTELRARALDLAERARTAFAEAGEGSAEAEADESWTEPQTRIDAWLEDHR